MTASLTMFFDLALPVYDDLRTVETILNIVKLYVESGQIPSVGVLSVIDICLYLSFSFVLGYLSMYFICNRCD